MSFECCVLLHVVASGATQGFVPDFLGAGSNFLSDMCLFLFFIISKVKKRQNSHKSPFVYLRWEMPVPKKILMLQHQCCDLLLSVSGH